jgi:hypothetical protein
VWDRHNGERVVPVRCPYWMTKTYQLKQLLDPQARHTRRRGEDPRVIAAGPARMKPGDL